MKEIRNIIGGILPTIVPNPMRSCILGQVHIGIYHHIATELTPMRLPIINLARNIRFNIK